MKYLEQINLAIFLLCLICYFIGCEKENNVEKYFMDNNYTYPVQLSNCIESSFMAYNSDKGEYYPEEHRELFNQGIELLFDSATFEWCNNLAFRADGFILSDPLIMVGNNGYVSFAVDVTAINTESTSSHRMRFNEEYKFWSTHNMALFRQVDSTWTFSGWVY